MRNLLWAAAALGAILTVVGVGLVVLAWLYPHHLLELKGATVTPDDVIGSFHLQLMGTIFGLMAAMAGLAINIVCFRVLGNDLERKLRR